jgi:hypothetical protein
MRGPLRRPQSHTVVASDRTFKEPFRMASPESQGKTIALVITIVLFVASSAAAFYFFNKVETFDAQRAEASKKAQEADTERRKIEGNYSQLREILAGQAGGAGDHAAFVENAKKLLVNPNTQTASKRKDRQAKPPVFENLMTALNLQYKYVDSMDKEIAAMEDGSQKTNDQLAKVSKIGDAKVETANEATMKKAAELKELQETTAKTLEERNTAVDAAQLKASKLSVDREQLKRNSEATIDDLNSQIAKLTLLMERARRREVQKSDTRFNLEDGEVVQLQSGGNEAYINIGRADGVIEGLTFGIYGIDRSGFVQNLPKANCEVVRILGDKRALARVFDYQISDPVVPGDKIFNPIWDQGRKTAVAILGIIDMDGDGVGDNDEFKRLIERWGGKIDAEVDLKTFKPVGRITTETDWLVEGKIPEPVDAGTVEAGDAANIRNAILAATNKFRKDAQVNGVRPVNVQNFLAYMGHRPVRKTQLAGEEDLVRKTLLDQKSRRIQANPGDVSIDDEAPDVERVKAGLRKKNEAKAAKPTKKKDDGDDGMEEGKEKKDGKGKKKTGDDSDL